ncbi:IS66 family insertion sequence element accessory protein TnpB (plasmid) [Comamonas antarctica]|uniref:IS66 family insertion sequence element accessory protein TnpB n=2 Tax=Comamonas antarctica TaxID=2743470 RepID=A0A6N1XC61_9BURK|nr:IS66 family insertion sequence element accessory protein TnpB [Comamonas antarctica]
MRAGTDTALARVVSVFGAAYPHHAYLFANKRANRIKVLVHDGIGIWLAARRLHQGKFVWPAPGNEQWPLEPAQLDALVLGLPCAWEAPASSPWSEAGMQSVDLRMTEQCLPWHTVCHVDAAAIPG